MTWKDKANAIIDEAVKNMKYYVRTDNLGSASSRAEELMKALNELKKNSKTPLAVRQTESTTKLMKMLVKENSGE